MPWAAVRAGILLPRFSWPDACCLLPPSCFVSLDMPMEGLTAHCLLLPARLLSLDGAPEGVFWLRVSAGWRLCRCMPRSRPHFLCLFRPDARCLLSASVCALTGQVRRSVFERSLSACMQATALRMAATRAVVLSSASGHLTFSSPCALTALPQHSTATALQQHSQITLTAFPQHSHSTPTDLSQHSHTHRSHCTPTILPQHSHSTPRALPQLSHGTPAASFA